MCPTLVIDSTLKISDSKQSVFDGIMTVVKPLLGQQYSGVNLTFRDRNFDRVVSQIKTNLFGTSNIDEARNRLKTFATSTSLSEDNPRRMAVVILLGILSDAFSRETRILWPLAEPVIRQALAIIENGESPLFTIDTLLDGISKFVNDLGALKAAGEAALNRKRLFELQVIQLVDTYVLKRCQTKSAILLSLLRDGKVLSPQSLANIINRVKEQKYLSQVLNLNAEFIGGLKTYLQNRITNKIGIEDQNLGLRDAIIDFIMEKFDPSELDVDLNKDDLAQIRASYFILSVFNSSNTLTKMEAQASLGNLERYIAILAPNEQSRFNDIFNKTLNDFIGSHSFTQLSANNFLVEYVRAEPAAQLPNLDQAIIRELHDTIQPALRNKPVTLQRLQNLVATFFQSYPLAAARIDHMRVAIQQLLEGAIQQCFDNISTIGDVAEQEKLFSDFTANEGITYDWGEGKCIEIHWRGIVATQNLAKLEQQHVQQQQLAKEAQRSNLEQERRRRRVEGAQELGRIQQSPPPKQLYQAPLVPATTGDITQKLHYQQMSPQDSASILCKVQEKLALAVEHFVQYRAQLAVEFMHELDELSKPEGFGCTFQSLAGMLVRQIPKGIQQALLPEQLRQTSQDIPVSQQQSVTEKLLNIALMTLKFGILSQVMPQPLSDEPGALQFPKLEDGQMDITLGAITSYLSQTMYAAHPELQSLHRVARKLCAANTVLHEARSGQNAGHAMQAIQCASAAGVGVRSDDNASAALQELGTHITFLDDGLKDNPTSLGLTLRRVLLSIKFYFKKFFNEEGLKAEEKQLSNDEFRLKTKISIHGVRIFAETQKPDKPAVPPPSSLVSTIMSNGG